jgi:hypothetical protein
MHLEVIVHFVIVFLLGAALGWVLGTVVLRFITGKWNWGIPRRRK